MGNREDTLKLRKEQAEKEKAAAAEEEIEEVLTPGAQKMAEQEGAKEGTQSGEGIVEMPPAGAAKACVEGLIHARDEFESELRGVWSTRHEVFWQLWNSDAMTKLGGRLNALMNVVTNVAKYPEKPFGLSIDVVTFFALVPELSPPAAEFYDKEPQRLFSLIEEVLKMDWERDTDELANKEKKLKNVTVGAGGYNIPFDESFPVSPVTEDVLDIGSRLAFYGNLRQLFLHQALFLSVSIILSQALGKKLIS